MPPGLALSLLMSSFFNCAPGHRWRRAKTELPLTNVQSTSPGTNIDQLILLLGTLPHFRTRSRSHSASGTGSCSQYTTEQRCQDVAAESDHCIWALPHGSQDDFEDEEDEVCRPMRCHDVDSVESSGDEALACSTFLANSCAFDQNSYVCWERGQTPDCEYRGAWEASMCPSPCVWDSSQYACNSPGSATPCGRAYDSNSCGVMATSGCTWTAGQMVDGYDECGVCYNRSAFSSGTPCDAYFGKPETCCPQASGCHWTVVMRPETEEPGTCAARRPGWHPCSSPDDCHAVLRPLSPAPAHCRPSTMMCRTSCDNAARAYALRCRCV